MRARRTWVFLLGAATLLVGCSLAGDITPPPDLATAQAAQQRQPAPEQPTQSAATSTPSSSLPIPAFAPNPSAGAAVYVEKCADCHGQTGKGDGVMAAELDFEPSPLADPEIARLASPADWYQVVTQGRMNRFMPPFNSLSDEERWHVVAYALSLSASQEERDQGQALFEVHCQSCHDMEAGDELQSFIQSGRWANVSASEMYALISEGLGEMPAFGEDLSADERWALAAYIQSLGFGREEAAIDDQQASGQSIVGEGFVRGRITNGTEGGIVPEGLTIQLVGFDGQTPTVEQEAFVDEFGEYDFTGVDIIPGRTYATFAEYREVLYFSEAVHFSQGESVLDLPITIFEVEESSQQVQVSRLHILFEFRTEGLVDVTQVWVVSNLGDKTLVGPGEQGALRVLLPEGSSNLEFFDAPPERFVPIEGGFLDREPIIPGQSLELIFGFTLPYSKGLDFRQPLAYPVGGVIVLTTEGGPQVRGEGVEDRGVRDMGGVMMQNYALGPDAPGEVLSFELSGGHPLRTSDAPSSSLILGAGALAAALFAAGLWFYRLRAATTEEAATVAPRQTATREDLLRDIAALDDAFEAGSIEAAAHHARRKQLKRRLMDLLGAQDD